MDNPTITGLSLCSGVGMLDEAVRLVLAGFRTACFCEWESGAASVLLARMEESSVEPTPIWCGDLGGFDARAFRGVVDILTAGLPCQPYSLAGKREGNTDARSHGEDGESGPIPQFLRIVGECRPAVVFLENVPPWVRGGHFRTVGEQLCRLGYDILEPVFLAAEDVGAAHKRERVFLLAYLADGTGERCAREWLDARAGWERGDDVDGGRAGVGDSALRQDDGRGRDSVEGSECARRSGDDAADFTGEDLEHAKNANGRGEQQAGASGELADAESSGGSTSRQDDEQRRAAAFGGGSTELADSAGGGEGAMHGSEQGHDGAGEHGECGGVFCLPAFAPAPNFVGWRDIIASAPHLAPATEPGVCLVADGVAVALDEARDVQLRCGGNGVVALCAAVAFEHLLRRLAGRAI